jgi:hypothetical protein
MTQRVIILESLEDRPARSVIVLRRDGTPFVRGEDAPFDFACGGCGRTLARAAGDDALRGLVFVCSGCGTMGQVRAR